MSAPVEHGPMHKKDSEPRAEPSQFESDKLQRQLQQDPENDTGNGIGDVLESKHIFPEASPSAVQDYLQLVCASGKYENPEDTSNVVLFKDVTVWGNETGPGYQESVASLILSPLQLVITLLSRRKIPTKPILQNIGGIVREGEMLLLLGKPGSGCTTLMKTLTGLTGSFDGWRGEIAHFGIPIHEITSKYRGEVVYNAEADVHFPYLNVAQTLEFAVRTKTPSNSGRSARKPLVKSIMDTLLRIFGIESAVSTLIGNDLVKGVSGGEKKRVSLAETMAMSAKVSLWDNCTQGLDATTSLRVRKALQTYVKSGSNVAIAALYQASDEIVSLFDKVTLLYEGQQIFFGTVIEATSYFDALGFARSNRQSLAEFLVSVTAPSLRVTKEGWRDRVPRTVDDFVRCWKSSIQWDKLREELNHPNLRISHDRGVRIFKSRQQRGRGHDTRISSIYVLGWGQQMVATLKRTIQRLSGDRPFLGASIVAPLVVSLIFGSVFYNTPDSTQGFFSRQGVIFFGILFNTVQTLGEITTQYAQRPIVEKQNSFAMYHPGIDAISSLVSIWPIKLISATLFNLVLYFMTNLKREPGAFFIFLLFTCTTFLLMSSVFRFVAAITKHEATATSIAGVLLLALVIYTGYVIPTPSMHPWFKWISYINPVAYSFESLMANEFHDREVPCSALIPSGPDYESVLPQNQVCPVTGSVPGSAFVSGDQYIEASFSYYHSHIWRNYGILISYFIFFIVAYGLAVEFVPQVQKEKGDILIFLRRRKDTVKVQNKNVPEEDHKNSTNYSHVLPDPTNKSATDLNTLQEGQDTFTWNDLNYEIPVKGGVKALLTGIYGYIKPGTMTALIGESGAGKTTLLNVLAKRTRNGSVRGDIFINGSDLDSSFQQRMGYVESQDVHFSQFTVRENMRFSAQLRLSQTINNEQKKRHIEDVIQMLEMEGYADAVVGVPGSGLNLEQRKRMIIGIELVARPSLLFLDEPTSGLDSQSAWSIITCLRKLANSGQAILCTIHQPSSALFEQFDRILLLQQGGRCVYFGNIGANSHDVIHYFEGNGAENCQPNANPAEYILQVTNARDEGEDQNKWAEKWSDSAEARAVERQIERLNRVPPRTIPSSDIASCVSSDKHRGTSIWYQYRHVQLRNFQFYWRSPVYIRGKLVLNIAAGLFLGFTFYNQQNSAQGLQNKMFATFTSLILSAPLMNQLQPRYIEIRDLYVSREEPSKMYHWSVFVVSTVIVEALTNIITGTLFFIPWYFAVGFWRNMSDRNARSAFMWIMLVMFEMWASTFGQLLAALAPNAQIAALFIPLTFMFVVLFCGILQPVSQLVPFWHWVHYASPFTWLIDALFSNVLHNTEVHCDTPEINIFQPLPGKTCQEYAGPFLASSFGALYNPDATEDCQYCRYSTGDEYLRTLDMSWNDRWRNFGFMWAYVFFNVGMIVLVTGLPRVVRRWRSRGKA